MVAVTPAEMDMLIAKVPLATELGITVQSMDRGRLVLRLPLSPLTLRPVETISGPAMMTLADMALWAVVLTVCGPQELVVTTNLNIHFLRRAGATDLLAEAVVLKMGRRLAVTAVELVAADSGELVAHATASYAIPPA